MENNQQKKSNGLVYVLVALLIGLLGATLYLASQKKKIEQKVVYVTDEKQKLQAEVDRLTVELTQATNNITKLNGELSEKEKTFQTKLNSLRVQLVKADPTKVAALQKELASLRNDIAKYLQEIAVLKKENEELTVQRDSLKTTVVKVTEKAAVIEKENVDLSSKNQSLTKAAAALKAANITVVALKVKNSGKEVVVEKAKKTKKLKVTFKVHQNNLASRGLHDVFLQVQDAAGNVLEGANGGSFTIDERNLVYTHRASIDFTNDDREYMLDWTNTQPFISGDLTIVLYCDGYVMGKAKLYLK